MTLKKKKKGVVVWSCFYTTLNVNFTTNKGSMIAADVTVTIWIYSQCAAEPDVSWPHSC